MRAHIFDRPAKGAAWALLLAHLTGCATQTRPPTVEMLANCARSETKQQLGDLRQDDTVILALADQRFVQLTIRNTAPGVLVGSGCELRVVNGAVERSEAQHMEVRHDQIVAICDAPHVGGAPVLPIVILSLTALAVLWWLGMSASTAGIH